MILQWKNRGFGSAPSEYRKECRPDIDNAAWSNSGVWNSSGAASKEGLLLRVGKESIVDGVCKRMGLYATCYRGI